MNGDHEAADAQSQPRGDNPSGPDVCLVFKDERSRMVFLHYLKQVENGKIKNPSVEMMLDSLVEPLPD